MAVKVKLEEKGEKVSDPIEPTPKTKSQVHSSRTAAKMTLQSMASGSHFLPALGNEKVAYQFSEITPVLEFLGYNQGESSELLETNPSTFSRWKNSDKPVGIGKLRSKVVNDIDEIISKGIRIFGSEKLFQEWLNTTNYSLGDVRPVDLLKDVYAIGLVEESLDALSWGSYL